MSEIVGKLLRDGPTDISTILYGHMRPVVQAFLETGEVTKLQDHFEQPKIDEDTQMALLEAEDWLEVGLQYLHDAQEFFADHMPTAEGGRHHQMAFKMRGQYDSASRELTGRFLKYNRMSREERDTIKRWLQYNPQKAGVHLSRPLHLGILYGSYSMRESQPVAYVVTRIKDPRRFALKQTRNIGIGLLELGILSDKPSGKRETITLKEIVELSQRTGERGSAERREQRAREYAKRASGKLLAAQKGRIAENLGYMHKYGMETILAGEQHPVDMPFAGMPNPEEYLFMRAQINDTLGVMGIPLHRDDAETLMQALVANDFKGKEGYTVLQGPTLERKRRRAGDYWTFNERALVDNHIRGPKSNKVGNKNIFAYVVPRKQIGQYHHRLDIGVQALPDKVIDAVGGPASHVIYEATQEAKVRSWPRRLQELRGAMLDAIMPIVTEIDVHALPLFPETRQRFYRGRPAVYQGAMTSK